MCVCVCVIQQCQHCAAVYNRLGKTGKQCFQTTSHVSLTLDLSAWFLRVFFFMIFSRRLPLSSFFFPSPSPSSLHLCLSLSCLCFSCRSEVSSVCCIHFQFPFCGGIPLVIMLPFPTLVLGAGLKPLKAQF